MKSTSNPGAVVPPLPSSAESAGGVAGSFAASDPRALAPKTYTAKLLQGGIVVAEVSAPTIEQAEREIVHYAMMYAQDGPVIVKLPKP